MSEYIERGALIAAIWKETEQYHLRVVMDFPAADVERVVRGERKEKTQKIDGESYTWTVCSSCDADQVAGLGLAKRCYNCGAHFGAHMERTARDGA